VAGYVPFQTAAGGAGGFPLTDSFGSVGAGFEAVSGAGDGEGVDGLVEGPVAVSVEPVAGVLPGGGLEGGYAGEASERGFVAASAWVGPGDVYLRGGDRAYSVLVQQLGSDRDH